MFRRPTVIIAPLTLLDDRNILSSVQELKHLIRSNNSLYFYSKNNKSAMQTLAHTYSKQFAYLDLTKNPAQLENFPIYFAAEDEKESDLIKKIGDRIKNFVVPPVKIILISNDLTSTDMQCIHPGNNSLLQIINDITQKEAKTESALKMGLRV